MSKLVTDKIQKSGGEELTLPSAQATADHQPLVGATDGTLSHSPIALPATVGTDGQVLTSTGAAASAWEALETPASSPMADNDLMIGAIFTSSCRDSFYSTGEWNSSGPWTTYYHSLSNANSITQAWNMLLGDGLPQATNLTNSTSGITYSNSNTGVAGARVKLFAHNRRLGWVSKQWEYDDGDSGAYSGCTWSCLPIRNKGSANVDISLKRGFTSYNNYGGSGIVSYRATYSSGTNYANATGGAWTTHNAYTSDTSYAGSNNTQTITIPAGETILVMMTTHHRYHTTDMYHDIHVYAELQTAFTHADIQCDLRMLEALHQCRQPAANSTVQYPYEMYTSCATCFGDR